MSANSAKKWALGIALSVASVLSCAQPQGGEGVTFQSPQVSGGPLVIRGVLYKPAAAPKGSVVLVHGSSGWSDAREGHYGRAFSAAGYAALAIDTFGPRNISNTVSDQGKLTTSQQVMDAFAARGFLLGLGYPAGKTAVMGFSRGGTVAIQAADTTFVPDVSERFAAAIPFYPGCTVQPRRPKPASVMYMALGEKDDWVGTKSCLALAEDYARAGGKVRTKVYPGAAHGFDGAEANTRMFRIAEAETFVDCVAFVEPDATLSYGGKSFAADGVPAVLEEMRKTCVKRGASVWSNPGQKEAATRDVLEFLGATFQ